METSYEVEGTAFRRLIHAEEQQGGQGQPASHAVSASDALSTCTSNFPMLSPHEIATLILIAHTPGEVSAEWPDLQPLLSGNLQVSRVPRPTSRDVVRRKSRRPILQGDAVAR
jgi:hypothetical protein